DVKASHSLNWLIDVLIANLREQSEPETIGAAIILADVLSTADIRSTSAKRFIMNASRSYQIAFCEAFQDSRNEQPEHLPTWVVEIALRLLLKDDWYSLGKHGVS